VDEQQGTDMNDARDEQRRPMGWLAKWGPLGALSLGVAVLLATVNLSGTNSTDEAGSAGSSTIPEPPAGVVSFSDAVANGDADALEWGERCDTSTGTLALPARPAPECFLPFEGDNGGATSTGVTADAVKVVVYLPQANDPVLSFIYRQIGNDDTPDDVFATYEGFNELLGAYFETYGREVELVRYDATGSSADAVAATADAETISRDIAPFAVIGGPTLTEAFADTLAANEVLCISCAPGQTTDWYEERSPYVWDIQMNAEQAQLMSAEYIGKRLAGRPASFGGDDVVGSTRKLGLVYLSSTPQDEVLLDELTTTLDEEYGVGFEVVATYEDPVGLSADAREIIARMKDAGVTTVVFKGDPLAPQSLTRTATEQGFVPEWVLGGSDLIDTNLFARTYDQEQWAHAFGPSTLFARIDPEVAGAPYLYRWYHGEVPAAEQASLILPSLQLLYSGIQGAGPDLTPETFASAVFSAAISASSPVSPQVSWGERGVWPGVDFAGIDDQTEVWWDPDATGPNELGDVGAGMWTYAAGGSRYLPGEWPSGQPELFTEDGAVTMFDALPDGEPFPTYRPID
jgi:hypothetical protein